MGVFSGSLGSVSVGAHQTRVLKLVVESFGSSSAKRAMEDL
jgi:hypothetical protein